MTYRPRIQQYRETNRAFGPYLPPYPLQGVGAGIFGDNSGGLGSLAGRSSRGLGASCSDAQAAVSAAQANYDSNNNGLQAITAQMSSASPDDLPGIISSQAAFVSSTAAASDALTQAKNNLANCTPAPKDVYVSDKCGPGLYMNTNGQCVMDNSQPGAQDPKCSVPGQWYDSNSGTCVDPYKPTPVPSGPVTPVVPPSLTCPAGQQAAPDGKSCVPIPAKPATTNWLLIGGLAAAAAVGVIFFMGKKKGGSARGHSAAF